MQRHWIARARLLSRDYRQVSKVSTRLVFPNTVNSNSRCFARMKRSAPSASKTPNKKPRPEVPEYHLSPQVREADGSIQWPAPSSQLDKARQIILDWLVATDHHIWTNMRQCKGPEDHNHSTRQRCRWVVCRLDPQTYVDSPGT